MGPFSERRIIVYGPRPLLLVRLPETEQTSGEQSETNYPASLAVTTKATRPSFLIQQFINIFPSSATSSTASIQSTPTRLFLTDEHHTHQYTSHARAHTNRHAYKNIRPHTHTNIKLYTYTRIHITHTRTNTRKHASTHTTTHTYTQTLTHTYTHTRTYTPHTNTHARPDSHTHTCTYAHTRMPTHLSIHNCTYAHGV